ncbi:MAG: DUF3891 family protein [Litorilinea sp.]
MIVRELSNGRLLCIRQTTHALVSQTFCRHWGNNHGGNHEGNVTFARPRPLDVVLMAIGQHDNGWTEWEAAPEVRADGYPMDFLAGPSVPVKLALWQRGIDRASAQHPYAGLLIGEHAAALYANDLPRLTGSDKTQVEAFLAAQTARVEQVRRDFAASPSWEKALEPARLRANMRLLQFGDAISLRLCVPWAEDGVMENCPVDGAEEYTALRVRTHKGVVTFDPWPFGVDSFAVEVHGYVLTRCTFADHDDYRAALAAAPVEHLQWNVVRTGGSD